MARIIPLVPITVKSYNPERDGVTYSLLAKFKNCRELTRLYLKGWKPKRVPMYIVFGNITHSLFQKVFEDVRTGRLTKPPSEKYVKKHVADVEAEWRKENPKADAETLELLEITCAIAEAILPAYFKFWEKDFQMKWNPPETEFKHPFSVDYPKGHVLYGGKRRMRTFLRGKIDASFFQGSNTRPWLQETKTKSRIGESGESNLTDILPHEMQVGIYLLMLAIIHEGKTPAGLLYNIVRRPQVKPKKAEDLHQFAQRIIADVRKRPDYYFMRLRMTVDKQDLFRRQQELEDTVSDFLLWWKGESGHYKNSEYCENKYGTCNMLPICGRGDYSHHYRTDRIFTELEES